MLTRRRFLATTAGAALATGVQPALTQPAKKREIVDAQIHMWKASSADWPWDPGVKPQLPEPFTYERALPLMDETGIDRAVIVPPGLNYSNDYALEAAKKYPTASQSWAGSRLEDPKSAALVPTWRQQPGMLGVGMTSTPPSDRDAEERNGADWFWAAAEKAGLPVMAFTSGRYSVFEQIVARHPGMPLIIDHMGVNTAVAKEGKMTEAISQAVALAKYPNVSVKLSNLPNSSLEPYPFKDLTPHLRRVFDAYGPQRCYWGTDVTNGMARVGWKQRLTHFTEKIDFMSDADKDWVMGRSIKQRLKWA